MKMKILFYLAIALCLSCNLKEQPQTSTQLAKEKYMVETKDFLNGVYQKELKDTTYIFTNEPIDIDTSTLKEANVFTDSELKQIHYDIKNLPIKDWQKILSTNNKFLRSDSVSRMFKHTKNGYNDGWEYIYKTMGYKKIASISAPIFLRDYNYCLFYAGYGCGMLCGYGELVLYKKVNGKWKEERTFSSWIS